MKIDHINLGERPVFLVPVEDVTDLTFRLICKKFGADMVCIELTPSDALVRSANKTIQKLTIRGKEHPVAIQIYDKDTETMADAARTVGEAQSDVLDINFSYPIKKVAGKGTGASMLQGIPKMFEITRAVVDAVEIPITIKTCPRRDVDHEITVDLAEQLQDHGTAALAIHRCIWAQVYTDEADWTPIGGVKNNPRIHTPTMGDDGVASATGAKKRFERYGADATMIERGNIGRPRMFREMKYYPEAKEELPQESSEWCLSVLCEEMLNSVAHLDEHRGIIHTRRHLAATPLFKGVPNFWGTHTAMLQTELVEEPFRIFDGPHPTT